MVDRVVDEALVLVVRLYVLPAMHLEAGNRALTEIALGFGLIAFPLIAGVWAWAVVRNGVC